MKEPTLAQIVNRRESKAGQLLLRAYRVLQFMPSKVAGKVCKEIEEFLGLNLKSDT